MFNEITKEGYTAIVEEYQKGNETAYSDMLDYLKVAMDKHISKEYNRVKSYGYTRDEINALGLEILWVAMDTFDGSRGADFLAYFTQRLHWHVNNELIDKKGSLGDKTVYSTVSFDTAFSDNEEDSGDSSGVAEYDLADNSLLANSDSAILKVDYDNTYLEILDKYRQSAEGKPAHIQKSIELDVEIMEVVFKAVERDLIKSKELNDFMYNQLPDRDKNSLRRNKQNAFKRFGEFLRENI